MLNPLVRLQGLFFYFSCLPCCKQSARSDTNPLLDDDGNARELDVSASFGPEVPEKVVQNGHSSPGHDYHQSPAGPDSRAFSCKIS